MSQYKLTYFNGRGRAEPIRLLLAHAKVDYVDNRIAQEQWPELKSTMPFGQLPVLEEKDFTLTQSRVILKYLGGKLGYGGADAKEVARIDELVSAIFDLQEAWYNASEGQNADRKIKLEQAWLSEKAPFYMGKLEAIVEQNGGFLVNGKLTYVDFQLANFCYDQLQERPDFLDPYSAVKKHVESVFHADGVKEYVESRPKTEW